MTDVAYLVAQLGDRTPDFPDSSPGPDLFLMRPKRRLVPDGSQLFIPKPVGERRNPKTLGARVGRVLERSKMGKFVRWDVCRDALY